MWSKKYCDSNPNISLKETLSNFLEFIRFHQIPANVLMREIHPLGRLYFQDSRLFIDVNDFELRRIGARPLDHERVGLSSRPYLCGPSQIVTNSSARR